MKIDPKIKQWFLGVMFPLAMAACSGDSGTTAYNDDGGIGGTGVSSGPIEDFGSLWVNGVRFETDDGTVIIEGGRPIAVPDVATLRRYFRRGMIVQVHGTVNSDGKTGVADRVFYGDTLQGAIVAIDPAARRMTVLDREVRVDAETVIGESNYPRNTLSSFQVGNVVEVSGFTTPDGAIRATWVGLLGTDASGRAFDVETAGRVTRHDATAQTFSLGNIQVQYGGLSESRIPANLADGQNVEVRGRALSAGRRLEATYIAAEEDDVQFDEGEAFWLNGVVTQVTDSFAFEVDDRPIVADDETRFVGGTPADLKPNVQVQVEGEVDETGAFLAQRVVFRDLPPRVISLSQPTSLENEEGEDVAVQIVATTPPGVTPIYHAEGLPPGLALDTVTGLIVGVPLCDAAGVYTVRVSLEGSGSATAWVWTVTEGCVPGPLSRITRPPVIAGSEGHITGEDESVLFEVEAVDPDGDTLTFEAVGLPPGFVLDAMTGVGTGTPDCASAGVYQVILRVSDGTFTDETSFKWTVEEGC